MSVLAALPGIAAVPTRTETCDVLVVGGGAAGLSAALAAAETGVQVALVSKVYPMRSHTVAAEGGAAGVHLPADSLESHVADTVRAGAGLADLPAVQKVVENAPVELARLERFGMPFSRDDDGDVAVRPFGGMSQPRTWFAADKTGFHLLHTLYQTALQVPNITWFNEYLAVELILASSVGNHADNSHFSEPVAGANPDVPLQYADDLDSDQSEAPHSEAPHSEAAQFEPAQPEQFQHLLLTYSQAQGELVLFQSPTVVLATGGYARAWATSTNAQIVTGDGHALALRAGLPLRDMEFVQWHPTCLPGSGLLITEAARGEGGVLRDKAGYRYLQDFGLGPETALGNPVARQMELGPRDALSQAFLGAKEQGRTNKFTYASAGGTREIDVVDLDLTHLGAKVLAERLPLVVGLAKRYAQVDPAVAPIPVAPAAHYTMGGIPTDADGRVLDAENQVVPGLYAAGECAATGLHGANRLGSNSLVETLVLGRSTGNLAAQFASEVDTPDGAFEYGTAFGVAFPQCSNTAMRPSDAQTDETIAGLRYELGVLLDAKMGISLSDAGLAAAAAALTRLQVRLGEVPVTDTSLKYNTQWQEYVELTNMLLCAQATIAAAQARRESRGAFQNRDHPATGATAKHSYVRLTQDNLVVRHD